MWKYFRWQTLRVLYLKLMRHSGTPEYTARGVALGLFVGFLIPMGLQLAVVIPLAFLFKTSKVMAGAFTFVTNHLTVFLIYPVQCYIGSYLIFNPLSYAEVSGKLKALMSGESWREVLTELSRLGLELGLAFFAGGLLFAIISSVLGYFISLQLILRYRARRARKLAARRADHLS